ncbi:MAG: UTRA domain-containing protein [Anaerolineae bacterium]|nr:UTRA domain-containing protein [Anaerolineae bacterium]
MSIDYPTELQARFERRIVAGAYGRGQVIRVDHLAAQLKAPTDQVLRVLRTAQRKGLVADAAEGSVRVLGLPTTRFASVFTHTASSGLNPRSEVRQVEVERATLTVAERLRVDVGSPVYRYVRTRWVNEEALANQTNYMPFQVCPGLEHDDVRRYSFQKLLEEKYAAVLVEMVEETRLAAASVQDQAVLGLAQGANVLVVDRIALSATGWPLVWAEIRIRPDRFEYVAALWPEGAKLLK